MSSKGQTFMPDFSVSILVFGVILSVFLFSWNSVVDDRTTFSVEEDINRDAYYTSTFLVTTPGYPSNWTNETVEIPGFATKDNVLSTEKLKEFRNVSYESQSDILQAENFNITFRSSGTMVQLDGEPLTYGRDYMDDNHSTVIVVNRNVLVNKSSNLERANMRYVVWRQ